MSHKLEISLVQQEKDGFMVIQDTPALDAKEILKRACQKLGLADPVYRENVNLGSGAPVSGLAVDLKAKFKSWHKPVVFDTETGSVAFDNWPEYGANHPDVVAGRRRLGEGGRWGNLENLDQLRKEYENQANHFIAEKQREVAAKHGHFARMVESGPDRIVLEIDV